MKKSQFLLGTLSLIFILFQTSCVKDSLDEIAEETTQEEEQEEVEEEFDETAIVNLVIPEDFNFETSETVTITINDNTPGAIYTVYAYNNTQYENTSIAVTNDAGESDTEMVFETDELNQILFTGSPSNGQLQHTIMTPKYYSQLYLRRKDGSSFTSEILDINQGEVTYTFTDTSGKIRAAEVSKFKSQLATKRLSARNVDIDTLFCVNGSGQLFNVNPLDGNLTELAAMPQGSWTAAIDHANMYLYSIGRNNPHPLMRYDMVNDSWSIVGNVGMGGPRLDYNDNDGLLYFSGNNAKVYTIDPTNANTLSTWNINNLDVTNGGDLAFAPDGTLFLSSFGGLYRLDLDSNNVYQATRISADNLPFTPTSMTFDSNNELWLASNGGSSDLIIMDTVTGGWEYIFGPNSTSGVNFGRTINDLTTYTVTENVQVPDTDGDGIIDTDDEYPEDADKAFEQFTPSKYGWGTVAFEDLWPFQGDYDFNDTAVNYRFVAVLNADNMVVQLDIHFQVTSDGAGLMNGFGLEMESIAPSLIESVTGSIITENYINTASNGTEENQSRAVVILFDNHEAIVDVANTVSVKFSTPITTLQLGLAPFNPFLIVAGDRGREIHLPNRFRTSLGVNNTSIEGNNQDLDGNFQTDSGLPWGINIVHDFKVPRERVPVNRAYNFFNQWATSGGVLFQDWYKDNEGYRNESDLK
ncbi:LruC domain-containing protein [Muricauda sp. 2012CJ35-5]|uniref:LruC domain-containing protein n=1 Tax=Flagellimonas spongiicola TaxID=2942208 RepID=A0ABT0PMK6_9FLAO|nr:LruC domain-containing protein [Allomuricauda spongiicola]MCL6272595.1 LruC domain-containing protein [Allomuricauda spongiicola]